MTNKVLRPLSNGKRQCKGTHFLPLAQCPNRCIFFIMNILTFIHSNRQISDAKVRIMPHSSAQHSVTNV